ncbi:hypothetical protein ILUMI_09222 [Ignelater luminosus]|uniref:Uncharacterized protein n=1 Tax=Ignelater luminosus TaxID=2038154 RepID=A0A8K0D4A2_IGNLU|nr:hypothetical protein ILUMI_09222 [Ignelater luminosus]
MSEVPSIKLHYGPYIANGVIRHKTQRLHGVIQCLTKLGYAIEIVPSIHMDRLSVEMLGREIYRCNIKNLQFNIECKDDVICKRLVETVQEASSRLYADENFPQYHPVLRGRRVIHEIKNKRTNQDLFSSDIKLWFEIPKNPVGNVSKLMRNLEIIDGEEEKLQEADENADTESNKSSGLTTDADISSDSKIL